jgi:hypothetical protein
MEDLRNTRLSYIEAVAEEAQRAEAYRSEGGSPELQAAWAFRFCGRDVSTSNVLARAVAEVRAFLTYATSHAKADSVYAFTVRPSDIARLQSDLRGILSSLRGSYAPVPSLSQRAYWDEESGEVWLVADGQLREVFVASVLGVLSRLKKRIHSCRRGQCRRFFVPGRSDRRYCSDACKDAAGQQAMRERHSVDQRRVQRREKYERKVRRQHPKAKIVRRGNR